MLQILGWIACLYLVVKGLELIHAGMSLPKGATIAYVGAFAAFAGALFFLWLISVQFPGASPQSGLSALRSAPPPSDYEQRLRAVLNSPNGPPANLATSAEEYEAARKTVDDILAAPTNDVDAQMSAEANASDAN